MRRRKPTCTNCGHRRGSHRKNSRGFHEGACTVADCRCLALDVTPLREPTAREFAEAER